MLPRSLLVDACPVPSPLDALSQATELEELDLADTISGISFDEAQDTCEVFVDCLKAGKPMPIDIYDAAAWMCVSVLSEASIAQGGAPQAIPDFTDGKWVLREPMDVVELKH